MTGMKLEVGRPSKVYCKSPGKMQPRSQSVLGGKGGFKNGEIDWVVPGHPLSLGIEEMRSSGRPWLAVFFFFFPPCWFQDEEDGEGTVETMKVGC